MKEFNIYLVMVKNKPLMIRFIGTLIEKIFEFYNVPYKKITEKEYYNIKYMSDNNENNKD